MPRLLKHDLQIAARLFRKTGPPASLVFFVTSRCNLSCGHCFYWKELNQRKNELSLQEIEKISLSLPNLLSVSLTGGEPYLREDLPQIASLFERNAKVRNIQIPSNGFLVERTLRRAEELLQQVRYARVNTGVSLDGPEEIHNGIRQNPSSYRKAVETLRGLQALKPAHPNLSVGVALTVTAANQEVLPDFFRDITENLCPDAVTITLARGRPMDPSLTQVDPTLYEAFAKDVIRFRRRNRPSDSWTDHLVIAKEEETYRLVSEVTAAQGRVSPCYGGQLIGVLSEVGEVYLCETLDRSMGNIRDFDGDFGRLWSSAQAEDARRYQKGLGCQCTYECAMSVNTLFHPIRALRIGSNAVRSKWTSTR